MIKSEFVDKKRLCKQKYRIREIIRLQDRISRIDCQLSGPAGMKISDMPRNQNPFDKLSLLVQEKMDKEKKVKKLYPLFESENSLIISKIGLIGEIPQAERGPLNSVYQDILRYFYLEDKSWEDILEILKFERDDDTKLRLIHKWHGRALKLLEKIQK